jgi:ribonuclease VapC
MPEAVLDSSAIIAWLRDEPGRATVDDQIRSATVSAVNLAEVVGKLVDKGLSPEEAVATASEIPCDVEPFDRALALAAGALRAETRRHGLSLGDRACLALAKREELPAITADRAWAQVEVGVEIRMLR